MNTTTLTSLGPNKTPSPIKHLLAWIASISLLTAAAQIVFNEFGLFPGPENLLSLSWWGLKRGYIWQPFTYLFVQSASPGGITFFYLIGLFFLLYILWSIGSILAETVGNSAFLRFYFTCGILAGCAALCFMPLFGQYTPLATPAAAILAVVIAWSMAFPEGEMLLFFLIPMQTRWALAGLVGAILLVSLSQWDMASFLLYLFAVLSAYTYATMAWKWNSPFPITLRADTALAQAGSWLESKSSRLWKLWPFGKASKDKTSKIVDIRTGKPLELSDDAFMDAMLIKISRQGESSLSAIERQRMQKISNRKMKDSNRNR